MNLRKTTSLTTLLSFILLLFTSFILYVAPQGKVAYWANWKLLGIGKEPWAALHTNLGILFVVAGIIHTVLNWKAITAYLKKAQKIKIFTGDFNLALAITLFVTLVTFFELPPLHSIQKLNESLKDAAADKYGDPPYGHAEVSTLSTFCKRLGFPLDESIQKLQAANLKAVSAEATLAEIAEANDLPPQAIYNLINATPEGEAKTATPQTPLTGVGRLTLQEVCTAYGLNTEQVIQALKTQGIEAAADKKVKEIADENGTEPSAIHDMIQEMLKTS
jgi:predicted DNA-binding protein YlxM (UPF0122 family)